MIFVLLTVLPPRPPRLSLQSKMRSDVQTASVDGPMSSMANGVQVVSRLEDAEWYWGDISRYITCHSYIIYLQNSISMVLLLLDHITIHDSLLTLKTAKVKPKK